MWKVLVRWRKVTETEMMRKQLPSLGETTRAKQLVEEQCMLPIWSVRIMLSLPSFSSNSLYLLQDLLS